LSLTQETSTPTGTTPEESDQEVLEAPTFVAIGTRSALITTSVVTPISLLETQHFSSHCV
jgi:hypothetical protein